MAKLAFLPLLILLGLILGSAGSLLARLDSELIKSILSDPEILFAVKMSVSTALTSLVLAALISIPAAWVMARNDFAGKRLFNLALDLPMVTPPMVAGIGLLLLFGAQGPFSGMFPNLPARLFSPLGVIIAQTYVASSILTRSAVSAFISTDRNYVHSAYNLGLGPFKTFILVEIPLCWRQLIGGCILALARALGEFGGTLMLAGATRLKTETLPMSVYLNIASGDFKTAIACAVLLIFIAAVLLLCLHILQKPDGKLDARCS